MSSKQKKKAQNHYQCYTNKFVGGIINFPPIDDIFLL